MTMLMAASSSSAWRTTPLKRREVPLEILHDLGGGCDRVAGEEASASDDEPQRDGLVARGEDRDRGRRR